MTYYIEGTLYSARQILSSRHIWHWALRTQRHGKDTRRGRGATFKHPLLLRHPHQLWLHQGGKATHLLTTAPITTAGTTPMVLQVREVLVPKPRAGSSPLNTWSLDVHLHSREKGLKSLCLGKYPGLTLRGQQGWHCWERSRGTQRKSGLSLSQTPA